MHWRKIKGEGLWAVRLVDVTALNWVAKVGLTGTVTTSSPKGYEEADPGLGELHAGGDQQGQKPWDRNREAPSIGKKRERAVGEVREVREAGLQIVWDLADHGDHGPFLTIMATKECSVCVCILPYC